MEASFRRVIALSVFLLLFPTLTACSATGGEIKELSQKALLLVNEACHIYPEIVDRDRCIDKVVHSILSSRDVSPEREAEIIREQEVRSAVRHPPQPGDEKRTAAELSYRKGVYKVLDIIIASCAVKPVITDFSLCMDKAYHSILSSRDPHSAYMNDEEFAEFLRQMRGDLRGIGAEVILTEDKAVGVLRVLPGLPAEKAGVKDGDRIVAVVNDEERLLSASFATIEEAVKKIRGKPNSKVTLEILRGEQDERLTIVVVRAELKIEMVTTELLVSPTDPNATYAYVKLIHFGEAFREKMVKATTDILAAHKGVRGIIFDVRGNPGGLLNEVYEAVDAVADSPYALVSIRDNAGIHAFGARLNERLPESQPGDVTNGIPMAVLIDGRSASASEIFAGALKELRRAVIIGKGTWRKGSVQGIDPLPGGGAIKVTQAEYLIGSPTKWVAVQCVGVDPDIVYEKKMAWKPKKEVHECDLPGAIVSGGARSDDSMFTEPLVSRDPALYRFGEEVLEAVKAFDEKAFARSEETRKRLKVPLPKEKPEEERDGNGP